MAAKNTIRSLADQVLKMQNADEWGAFLDALLVNIQSTQRHIERSLNDGVAEDQRDIVAEQILACKVHAADIRKLKAHSST